CNPSIGGPGKSHLVAEIAALGGEMARAADRAVLQVRCLNTSKGPAVRAVRAQEDKNLYALAMKEAVEGQQNLELCQDEAIALCIDDGQSDRPRVSGIVTRGMGQIRATAVIVTAGTFLRGAMISGADRVSGGRAGDRADTELAGSIAGSGFRVRRLKTGTPPRIDARSVDFASCEVQPGSETPLWLSRDGAEGRLEPLTLPPTAIHRPFTTEGWRTQLACFRLSTNESTHDLIRSNLHLAPMFNGSIEGTGPRYCPSIEDKVARFGDKSAHPIFLEPEGWRTTELYVQGMSTSLPRSVQDAALRSIPALRDVRVTRYGYAVEYDAVDPAELTPTLETRRVESLFFAGQINGTSGYEEAAGQGLLAGVNAAAKVTGRAPLVLRRDQAYIGVMVDDLVSKPFDEPYRMLTSRAEFRLSLRPSMADRRLSSIAADRGLIGAERLARIEHESGLIDAAIARLSQTLLTPSCDHAGRLESAGIDPLSRAMSAVELLRRPDVTIAQVVQLDSLFERGILGQCRDPRLLEHIEESIKYGAFIERERREVERRAALEHRDLTHMIDYMGVPGLRYEASIKLTRQQPRTIGEASRLAGVTPSDIAALLIHTVRAEVPAN
ncbi:MAG: tRNA uridine-5-carboxymethylaminomethyl(34) synthesis enzyme MnmG, partial [Thermomicrobiales bacterium]|nr:tRNA uridine-5-carboxymethylaminomethyl(34) synthesis enzyme MnmG [Thermomicrobiales bacterium]